MTPLATLEPATAAPSSPAPSSPVPVQAEATRRKKQDPEVVESADVVAVVSGASSWVRIYLEVKVDGETWRVTVPARYRNDRADEAEIGEPDFEGIDYDAWANKLTHAPRSEFADTLDDLDYID